MIVYKLLMLDLFKYKLIACDLNVNTLVIYNFDDILAGVRLVSWSCGMYTNW